MTIHPSAIISDGAQIHDAADIGPYVVIGPNVKIGSGTKVGPHAVIDGVTTIGDNCRIYAGASIGLEPQDLRFVGGTASSRPHACGQLTRSSGAIRSRR